MAEDQTPSSANEERLTVSYSLPLSVVRAIEYHAYLHRVSKSEAVAQLIRKSAEAAPDSTPVSLALVG